MHGTLNTMLRVHRAHATYPPCCTCVPVAKRLSSTFVLNMLVFVALQRTTIDNLEVIWSNLFVLLFVKMVHESKGELILAAKVLL